MVNTTPLGVQIEDALKEEIIAGRLAAGQRIVLEELAAKWGVSSTPVRDAVRRLEAIGFVKIRPRQGIYVADLTEHTFRDVFELRIALETLAAESAAVLAPEAELDHAAELYRDALQHFQETGDRSLLAERDYQAHDLLMRHCSNAKLVEIMRDLRDLIDWAQATIVSRQPEAYEITVLEHLRIIEAMQARDVEAARQAVRKHLKGALKRACKQDLVAEEAS